MWLSSIDRREADQHERQVRAASRMTLPIVDIAGLVERTPEANRSCSAACGRFAHALAEHEVGAGDRLPGVTRRFAIWVEAHLAGVFQQRESSEAAHRQ